MRSPRVQRGPRHAHHAAADTLAWHAHEGLLYWNRSEHLTDELRSGIAWKNMPGASAAAEWARVGEGGSGLVGKYEEEAVVRVAALSRAS